MSSLTATLRCHYGTREDTNGAEAVTAVASDEDDKNKRASVGRGGRDDRYILPARHTNQMGGEGESNGRCVL
jgi:hypothetical protein